MKDVDIVCLPRAAVELLLQHQHILKRRFGVTIEPVTPEWKRQPHTRTAPQSSTGAGVALWGAVGALAVARRAFCQRSDAFTSRFAVHRLIVKQCKLVFDSADELALANRLWSGRRVLVCDTGELVVVREVRVVDGKGRSRTLTLTAESPVGTTEGTAGPQTLPAGQCVCWDSPGIPNTIELITRRFQSEQECQTTLRRLCGRVAPVENVWTDNARSRSLVAFDISRDPIAPAAALIAVSGKQVNGAQAQIQVTFPSAPVLVQLLLPQVLRLHGTVEEAEVRRQFAAHRVERVVHSGDQSTSLHFGTPTAALAALRQLPAAFVGRASLPREDVSRLLCRNVPPRVPLDTVRRALLAQAGVPDSVDCELQRGPGRGGLLNAVTVTFANAEVAVEVATKVQQLQQLDVADDDPLLQVEATAEALLRKLEVEHQLERTRLARTQESEREGSTASEAPSTSSGSPPGRPAPMAYPEAREQLEAVCGDCAGDPDARRRRIADVVRRRWPPVRGTGPCRRHKQYEVGLASLRCEGADGLGEVSCEWQHQLRGCRYGDDCNCLNRCPWVHPKELQRILKLDSRLAAQVGSPQGLTLGRLRRGLADHRKKMLLEADELLARCSQQIADAEARVKQVREQPYEETVQGMQRRRQILDASEQKVEELQKQRAEFEGARAAFLEAAPDSFGAARLFAREVYKRFEACLPIYAERAAILDHLAEDFGVLVLSAETGSGKSTQVVQYVSEVVRGRVLCTQPRRLAAVALAERVSQEMQVDAASGYVIQHQKGRFPVGSQVLFLTDAALLNAIAHDPMLQTVGAVVVDEVHERSINTDLVVAMLRRTLWLRAKEGRDPLRLVLTSATMNEALFAAYFARHQWDAASPADTSWCPVMAVQGRTFPVEIAYRAAGRPDNYENAAVEKVREVDKDLPPTGPGENHDVLVFVTQADEAERAARALAEALPECLCLPLHGSLDPEHQKLVLQPAGGQYRRKVVVATNLAETSVTIDGIGAVVDTGMAKQPSYDKAKDATVLRVEPIAQSSARQRAGRAGRTAPGKCYRLYSREEFDDMQVDTTAELLKTDTTRAILTVLRQLQSQPDWIQDVRRFPFVQDLGVERLDRALHLLFHLGALEGEQSSRLTRRGLDMARMPHHPRNSAVLYKAQELGVTAFACVVVGALELTKSLFRRERGDDGGRAFAQRYPWLGDVGVAAAVWVQSQGAEDQRWCDQQHINRRALKEYQSAVQGLLSEMLPNDAGAPGSQRLKQRVEEELRAVCRVGFNEEGVAAKLRCALVSGYFSNLALQVRAPRKHVPPAYFLPVNSQLGAMPAKAAFILQQSYPAVCFFTEMTDNRKLYVPSLFSVPQRDLEGLLPASFKASDAFQRFRTAIQANLLTADPEEVAVACGVALQQYTGRKGAKIPAHLRRLKTAAGLGPEEELVLQPDYECNTVSVMCVREDKRKLIAAWVKNELQCEEKRVFARVREWPVPGAQARAVVGSGGVCHEVLLSRHESICVRYELTLDSGTSLGPAADRLGAAVVSLDAVPQAFQPLTRRQTRVVTEGELAPLVQRAFRGERLGGMSYEEFRETVQKRRNAGGAALQRASVAQAIAATAYTLERPAFYKKLNWLLRTQDVAGCQEYEPFTSALMGFMRVMTGREEASPLRTLYRGSGLSDGDLAKLRVPQAMTVWSAFTSVSESCFVALRFMRSADVSEGQRRVLFEISSPFGCSLDSVTLFEGEAEVLLPAYSVFVVESVEDIDDPMLPHVRICLTHTADSSEIPVEAAGTGLVASGPAATGLTGSSEVSDAAEAADLLLRLFADLDANADVEVMSNATGDRLWGRCWFSTSEIAAAAQRRLNGHVLGNRELSVRMAPVGTEGFGLPAKVRVTLTGVEHKGTVPLAAGSEEQAQALRALASGEGWLTLRQGVKVRLGPWAKQKGGPADPLMFLVSNVPPDFTEQMLQRELARLCPCLPPDAVKRLHRDKRKVEEEHRALARQSAAEQRERMLYVSSMAGAGLLDIQEEAMAHGARFVLWMDSAERASDVARRLDGAYNRDLRMRVFARADCTGEFVMRQDVHRALAGVVDEAVKRVNARMAREKANVRVRSSGPTKPHVFSIIGDNARLMAQAYDELARLQRGEMVGVLPRDRSKLFPPRVAKEEAARVAQFLRGLQDKHGCFIKAQYSTSTVHVAGSDVARAAVRQALKAYLSEVPYTTQLHVPPRYMGAIKELLNGGQYPTLKYCTPARAVLKLESCDYDLLMDKVPGVLQVARGFVLMFRLKSIEFNRRTPLGRGPPQKRANPER